MQEHRERPLHRAAAGDDRVEDRVILGRDLVLAGDRWEPRHGRSSAGLSCDMPGDIMARSAPMARGKGGTCRTCICRENTGRHAPPSCRTGRRFGCICSGFAASPPNAGYRCRERSRHPAAANPVFAAFEIFEAAPCNYLNHRDISPKTGANNSAKTAAYQRAFCNKQRTNTARFRPRSWTWRTSFVLRPANVKTLHRAA